MTETTDDFVFPSRPTATTGSDELSCEECGKPISYSGRGRKPKRCNNCRPKATGAKRTRNVESLTKELERTFTDIGNLVKFVDGYDGLVIVDGSPRLAASLGGVAERNPTVRKGLESFVAGSSWGAVIAASAGIAVPILMHHGILPTPTTPHKEPPKRTFTEDAPDSVSADAV